LQPNQSLLNLKPNQEVNMKKHFGQLVSPLLAVSALILSVMSLTGWADARAALQAERSGTPTMISYQGMVMVAGVPYDDSGYFKFAILETDGGVDWTWSNDGTYPPSTSVPLPVKNGLFAVNLGDTSLTGMEEEINYKSFGDPTTFLRVWFSEDGGVFTQLPDQAITSVPYAMKADISGNSDLFAGKAIGDFQMKLNSSCTVGSAIRSISQGGIVVCEPIKEAPTFSLTTPDPSIGDVGKHSSIAIGTDGLPLISYYDATNGNLMVAHCDDVNCTSATLSTLDSIGDVGLYTAIAIGGDGLGMIAYRDATNLDLKYAHCDNINCTTANLNIVSSTGDVGTWNSIVTGGDGYALISFYNVTNSSLRVAHCINALCSSRNIFTIDETGDVGMYNDITVNNAGFAFISYYDATSANLKAAYCTDIHCENSDITVLDSTGLVGKYTSVTINGHSNALISYYDETNQDLKVALCNPSTCSAASLISVLDSVGNVGGYTSIVKGIDGLGLISYIDNLNWDLKVAHCNNIDCTSATTSVLQTMGHNLQDTSIVIGADGMGIISYYYTTFMNLMTAHCSNELCLPINWRQVSP